MRRFELEAEFLKADEGLGLVMGWAIVCTEDGEPYYDKQGDFIPEDAMLEAATDFMLNSRTAKAMHNGPEVGTYAFAFPLTDDVKKAFGIRCDKTGLIVAMKTSPEVIRKYAAGEYTGFSIGGFRVEDEPE